MNMKRWLFALLVLVSLSVATLIVVTVTHPKNGVPYTPEAVSSYVEAVCYATNHGLPPPTPIQFDNGEPIAFSCSVPDA